MAGTRQLCAAACALLAVSAWACERAPRDKPPAPDDTGPDLTTRVIVGACFDADTPPANGLNGSDGPDGSEAASGGVADAGVASPASPAPAQDYAAAIAAHLRAHVVGVRRCFDDARRSTPALHGALTLSLRVAANGSFSDVAADGVTPEFERCVTRHVSTLRGPPPAADTAIQCALAVGRIDIAHAADTAPVLAITKATIALNGRPIAPDRAETTAATPPETSADREPLPAPPSPVLDALNRARAERARALGNDATAGVLVLRPDASLDFSAFAAVHAAAAAAGFTLSVLERHGPTGWTPLHIPERPSAALDAFIAERAVPRLRVEVEPDRIAIGDGAGHREQIRGGARGFDLDRLRARLSQWKRRPAFADRTDVHIAVSAQVPYVSFGAVIAAAAEAGFPDYALAPLPTSAPDQRSRHRSP